MSDSFATENERLLDVIVKLGAENNQLKAENERLKKALKKIEDLTFMPRNKDKVLDRTWHITRAALTTDTNVPTNATDMDDGRRSMTDNFFSNIGIKILLNEIKDKLIEKLFLDLPLDKQQEILKEILSENTCKCELNQSHDKGEKTK